MPADRKATTSLANVPATLAPIKLQMRALGRKFKGWVLKLLSGRMLATGTNAS